MAKVAKHVFAEKSAHLQTDTAPLQRVSDRYAVDLANAIGQLAGHNFVVASEKIRFMDYGKWANSQESFSSLSVFRILPLRGSIILRLDQAMINSLINVYFGGAFGPVVGRNKDGFRESELRLIERLGQLLTELLCDHFSDYGSMKPALQRHETSVYYITGHDPKEQVMSQLFRITASEDMSWPIELLYSADAAESVMEFVQNKSAETPVASDPEWQQQWFSNLQQIHLPLRTILAQPTMRLPELFDMKPGDVIPITPRVKPPLFVANHKFATGTLGEKNGCAAFKIEHMEQGDVR